MTLYTVNAVVILDSNGKRVLAKYYDHSMEFVNSSRKQESFEKSIHEKTRKQNSNSIKYYYLNCAYIPFFRSNCFN